MFLTACRDHDLVEMPLVSKVTIRSTANVGSELNAEFLSPRPDCLVRKGDATLSQKILNHPQTERKPEIQPDRQSDHVRRKSMAVIVR